MNDNDIIALEQLIEKYPWYSLAHLELYKKFCERGPEARGEYLPRAAAFVHSRELLYEIARINDDEQVQAESSEEAFVAEQTAGPVSDSVESQLTEPVLEPAIEPLVEPVAEKVSGKSVIDFSDDDFFELIPEEVDFVVEEQPKVFAGGDYFTRREMDAVSLDETKPIDKFISEKPSLLRGSATTQVEPIIMDENDEFEDSGFYTETLARIYAEQGLVKRAVDVYAKLILLYPEKSTYFASLVKELKTKHNI